MTKTKLSVLVVDDDDISVEMVERALGKVTQGFEVIGAEDGQAALDFLRGAGGSAVARPYIILLDLNMPRMNGFEFLEAVRADPVLKDSVIFVLTTSDADTDRTRAYQDQVAGYMVKSNVGPQFCRVAHLLMQYREAVLLP